MKQMSESAVEALSDLAAPGPPDYWKEANWCLISCPNGEYATIQEFGTEDEVVSALRKLDGLDVVAFVVHGRPAKISRKPFRFLILPDEQTVVPFADLSEFGVPGYYKPEGLDLAIQEDGFLGPAELTLPISRNDLLLNPKALSYKPDNPPRHNSTLTDDSDGDGETGDDDDDEEFS